MKIVDRKYPISTTTADAMKALLTEMDQTIEQQRMLLHDREWSRGLLVLAYHGNFPLDEIRQELEDMRQRLKVEEPARAQIYLEAITRLQREIERIRNEEG